MKSLEKFENLKIKNNEVILVEYPLPEEGSKLFLSTISSRKQSITSRPLVVAKISDSAKDYLKEDGLEVEVGSLVFGEFVGAALHLIYDKERVWKNPMILQAYTIRAVLDNSELADEYDKLAESVNEKIEEINKRIG
jgi:hypothetical protein